MDLARIAYSLAAAGLLLTSGCLEFDGPTGLEGRCWDWVSESYVFCDAGASDATDAEPDSGVVDAARDAGWLDVGFPDTGLHPDAQPVDVGFPDSGLFADAEPAEAGPVDSGEHPDAEPHQLDLLTEPEDFGVIEIPAQAAMCPPNCSWNLFAGESLSLHAQPRAGYRFGDWTGACRGPSSDCVVASTTATSATARFLPGGVHWAEGWLAGARILDLAAADSGESYVLLSFTGSLTIPGLGTYADPGFLLLALDASGLPRWGRHFVTTPTAWARLALQSSDLHVALSFEGSLQQPPAATTIQSAGGSDFLLLTLSAASGVTLRTLEGRGSRSDYVADLAVDTSGSVYLAGTFSSTDLAIGAAQPIAATSAVGSGFVAKATSTGFVPFARVFGNSSFSFVTSVAVAQSGLVYVGGFYTSNDFGIGAFSLPAPAGDAAPFLAVVTSGSGQSQWARTFSAPNSQSARILRLAAGATDVFAYGAFSGGLELGSGFSLQSVAAQDAFIVRVDPAAVTQGAYKFGSDVRLDPGDLQVLDSDNLAVTLHFEGLLSFDRLDGLVGVTTLPAMASADFYIAVLEPSAGGLYRHAWGRRFGAAGLNLSGAMAVSSHRLLASLKRSTATTVDFDGVSLVADAFLVSLGR